MGKYEETYSRWQKDPVGFWAEAAKAIDWDNPPTSVFDPKAGVYGRWFVGAKVNTCFNAVDRHVARGRADLRRKLRDVEGGAALQCSPFPHQVDDQTAHDPGRVAYESLAIGKHGILPGHVEVGFMQKGGRTDRRTRAAPQLPLG